MEKISALSQIENLTENSICIDRTGENIKFSNSEIIFKGTNNLLYPEPNVKLKNSSFCFNGSNSIIYLSGSKNTYYLHCAIPHNSTIFKRIILSHCIIGVSPIPLKQSPHPVSSQSIRPHDKVARHCSDLRSMHR